MDKVENGVTPLNAEQPSAEDDPRIGALMEWVRPIAFEYAKYMGKQTADAEDIAQDIVLHVCDRSRIKPYYFTDQVRLAKTVCRAVRNVVYDGLDAEELHGEGDLTYANNRAADIREGEDPEHTYDLNHLIDRLTEASQEFAPRCGQVLEAILRDGLSHAEAAAALGIGESAISQQVIRGEHKLMEALESLLLDAGFKTRATKSPPKPGREEKQ